MGGVCPVPNACLKRDKTIIMRVKEVIKITIDGTIVRIVMSTSICKERPYSEPSSFEVRRVSAGPLLAKTSGAPNNKKRQRREKLPISARGLRLTLSGLTKFPKN